MSRVQSFTQTQVQKVLRAAKIAGYDVSSIEVDRDGRIVARFGNDAGNSSTSDWDDLLNGKKRRASS